MNRSVCALAVVAIFLLASSMKDVDRLEAGFANPPAEARLRCYWWWLNGNTTREAITRDLEEMKAKGYGGALLVDADGSGQRNNIQVKPGPMFGTPEWRALFRHAVREAARLGLELSLNIESGWNLGGPNVKPEQGSKLLTWSRTVVHGPAPLPQSLPAPPIKHGFYREIAVLAYPLQNGDALPGSDGKRRPVRLLASKIAAQEAGFSVPVTWPLLEDEPSQPSEQDTQLSAVQNITGKPSWSVPEGTWEILRIGYTASGAVTSTSSGAWQGLAIDHMDHNALEQYWRENLDPMFDEVRPHLGKAFRYLATDSWELGGTNWTYRFADEFRKRRGYDPIPYLPAVTGRIVNNRETGTKFFADLRRTIGDLIIAEHYQPYAALAAKYGMGIHPESGGPHGAPIDALQTLSVSTFPQTEFWARSATHRTREVDRFFLKEASSVAHTYGKTLVAAEGPTSIGPQWDESLGNNLKPSFDQAICEGLNRLVWHTFTSSPKEAGLPGQEYFAGTHLNPNVTWWHEAGAFLTYINRTQFLLQQGKPVSDVAYYYGDHVPNFVRTKSDDPAKVLPGYDYDVVNQDVLVNRMTARDGRIVLPDGVSYRALVLPDHENISLAALKAIRNLVNGGAMVIGPVKPTHATGMESDSEIQSIANEVWPRVKTSRNVREVLAIPPDLASSSELDHVHRRTADADIYFVRNTRGESIDASITLRITGKAPEFWHPDTGEIEPNAPYEFTSDGRTTIPYSFEPNGSIFIVLRRATTKPREAPVHWTELHSTPITASWTITFTPNRGAPATASFDHLVSWTENSNPGIKYFSGTGTYTTHFTAATANGTIELDLGEVHELAHVKLNGTDLGVLWKAPYKLKLGKALRQGDNTLEVAVTNFWPNRIIGDASRPPAERITHTNITRYTADSPLLPSGLIGPVVIRELASAH